MRGMTRSLRAALALAALARALRAPRPISGPWPQAYPAKQRCSKCGLCDTSFVSRVKDACAFLGDGMARIDALEPAVHGRARRLDDAEGAVADEAHFGVHERLFTARATPAVDGAQWTGIATTLAASALSAGLVDAVVVVAGDARDPLAPAPLLCRTEAEIFRGRGVKPSLCPSLEVLDEVAADASIARLLFCGVGCAVQALRALDPAADLGLAELYVMGTNCVDNSPSARATRDFVGAALGAPPEEGAYYAYEFMQDFQANGGPLALSVGDEA